MAHRKLKSNRKNRPGGALQLRLSSTVSAPQAHDIKLIDSTPATVLRGRQRKIRAKEKLIITC
jgi:hypothetical protein